MENLLLPVLKEKDYKKDRPSFLKEKLFNTEESPVIAFGRDIGTAMAYEYSENVDNLDSELNKARQEAFENLKSIEIPFSVEGSGKDKFFVFFSHEYSSEKILDKDFLNKVHKELEHSNLIIAIPHKGIFFAVRADSDLRLKLPNFAIQKFQNPEADRITPYCFNVINGEINAMLGENKGNNKDEMSFVEDSKGNFKVSFSSKTMTEFIENLKNSYQHSLLQAMQKPNFGGRITFEELNKKLEFNKEMKEKCNNFVKGVKNNELAQTLMKAINKSDLIVEVYQNNTIIAPINTNTSKKSWWKFGKYS